jgi:hypothetical protein
MASLPAPGQTLLGAHLGSEAAAGEERLRIRYRQREEEIRSRTLALRESIPDESSQIEIMRLRDELASVRDELRSAIGQQRLRPIVEQMVREILIEELPEAVEVIIGHFAEVPQHHREKELRNGQAQDRR